MKSKAIQAIREAAMNEITFIDLRKEFAFKRIFGTHGNEDLLLMLINAIVPERNITNVILAEQEHPGLREDSRKAVFDVFCKTSDGADLTIEMQYREQGDFNLKTYHRIQTL